MSGGYDYGVFFLGIIEKKDGIHIKANYQYVHSKKPKIAKKKLAFFVGMYERDSV